MSEKRKPKITMLLKIEATNGEPKRTAKIEIYPASLWEKDYSYNRLFRVRFKGKWFKDHEGKEFFYKTELRDIIWRSIPFY